MMSETLTNGIDNYCNRINADQTLNSRNRILLFIYLLVVHHFAYVAVSEYMYWKPNVWVELGTPLTQVQWVTALPQYDYLRLHFKIIVIYVSKENMYHMIRKK